ncbi:hypothetical protein [Clostridium thermarum]|uniref:hypothetical protein n=1 Tax=Clostridium thermarum TaxID=1716543 RepID=UPI0013D0C3B1|nr:hypothetical protein [Clostridium thermarum]
MDQTNLDIAKQEIEEALKLVEDMEAALSTVDSPKDLIKEKFDVLSKKVQELENILKTEGIL